ncbi:hypothetical protein [Halopseudomonas yangmingensis]|uniref:Uncharacterized protein n=1 Tax=Halopseudomonas yangmingensis TaxID=1720063 RepID=A0A1I4USP4_9GAMM|nr:hypothetical protein [Halopseudomonas yangmingensis]SFM91999.1 hypothetical protein SAMN05216217_1372 [Halopseudomonas yangmingensis]
MEIERVTGADLLALTINLGHNVGSVSVIGDACPTIWGENSLIEELLLAESNFRKSTPLDYEFFPQSFTNGYNSNSFIAGLLNHVGLPAATPNNVPGFDKPVPIEHFR